MELVREELRRTILDPRSGFAPVESVTELRWDPLTGDTARLLRNGVPLLPAVEFDIAKLAADTRAGCPFCPERVLAVTPRFPESLVESGRIEVGGALLFPNLVGLRRVQLGLRVQPEPAQPAAGGDDPGTGSGQSGGAGGVLPRGAPRRLGGGVGVGQRQPHAAGWELAVPSAQPRGQ
jgi:hypothetical protein